MQRLRPSSRGLGLAAAGLALALATFGCDQKGSADIQPTDDESSSAAAETKSPPSASVAAPATATAEEADPEPAGEKEGDEEKAEADDGEKKADPAAPKAKPDTTAAGAAAADKTDKAKAAEADKVTKGEDVGAASFSTWLQASGSYEAGKQGTVTAVLVAKDPYKCNAKYPYKFKTAPPSGGITYPQTTVRGMQVSPKRSTMSIPFVPSQPGKATVSGEFSFSICTDERCVIEKRNLTVTVDVK